MKYLQKFPVFFYHRERIGDSNRFYNHLVGKKLLYADNAKQAKFLAIAINEHDKTEWDCDLNFNHIEVGLPILEIMGEEKEGAST